ncbi:MAG: acylneuraminate cytidylyltransferase family protein [Candidatus Aenigmarchaeota archaeon]|nr:acylneuraminate cytidylyltransferase family protein [Candidatus Aenigmarchaeota archaeon]
MNKPIILGIIPARGGSKGVIRKNLKLLAGKPLITYTIEAAKKSRLLDRFVVSTEDKEIAEVSRMNGVEVINRPVELASDHTPTEPVLQHVVKELEKKGFKTDIIVTLQPTSPLRKPEDIDMVIEYLIKSDSDSVITISNVDYHPWWMRKLEGDKILPFIKLENEPKRRQDLPKVYKENGAVFVTKRDVLMNQNSIYGNNVKGIIMDEIRSIDIDTEKDFIIAETILKKGLV